MCHSLTLQPMQPMRQWMDSHVGGLSQFQPGSMPQAMPPQQPQTPTLQSTVNNQQSTINNNHNHRQPSTDTTSHINNSLSFTRKADPQTAPKHPQHIQHSLSMGELAPFTHITGNPARYTSDWEKGPSGREFEGNKKA